MNQQAIRPFPRLAATTPDEDWNAPETSVNGPAGLSLSSFSMITSPPGVTVPFQIRRKCSFSSFQPISLGVPFPKGQITESSAFQFLDGQGRPVTLQTRPLAHWSDGSIQWLLLDFLLHPTANDSTTWNLTSAPDQATPRVPESMGVIATPDTFQVDTGLAQFTLNRTTFRPFDQVRINGKEILNTQGKGLVLTDEHGKPGIPRVEKSFLETQGPVRTTVYLEGKFFGRVPCRFVARLSFYSGTGLVKLSLTVHNPHRARHPGGLWDLGDRGSLLFRDLSLDLVLAGPDQPQVLWSAEPDHAYESLRDGFLEIYQDSSGGPNWQSRTHLNQEGRIPCSFSGYRVRANGSQRQGKRANPVIGLLNASASLAVAVPEFWQQFPKALEVNQHALHVRLFPEQWDDLFELQGGEQKTHTVWFSFHPPAPGWMLPLDWIHQPAQVSLSSEWYAATGALPLVSPGGQENQGWLRSLLEEGMQGPQGFIAGREVIDEYGWRNFGEVNANHEAVHYPGPAPVISHYNNQYDLLQGAILQYCQTGQTCWLDLFDPLARHVLDIDIYHTDKDRAAFNHGPFWHTDHYRDAATATHRCYSRANVPLANGPYGGGPCCEHNYTTGLLLYYYLTGNIQARDAVLELANWVVQMDDGRNNVLGWVSRSPTGLASATRSVNFHGPGRGSGNSVNTLLNAWLVSKQRPYLDKAEELIRRVIHPRDDVVAHDLLNVEDRWSYTVFLVVLARYLDLKAEAGELDYMYAYGRAGLLRYAQWMVEHEVPYFDQLDRLEYPTETWAAQDLRKANVLRLAAMYSSGPFRLELLSKATLLADRAWRDLMRFGTRTMARPMAILLAEGVRDQFFRSHQVATAPAPTGEYDFGSPQKFVPQRQRVLDVLKSRGLHKAVARFMKLGK